MLGNDASRNRADPYRQESDDGAHLLPRGSAKGIQWTAAIYPEDVDAILDKWRSSIASGEPFLHEARVRRADGEYRWMLHHNIAVRDECDQIVKWYGSSVDIEDGKRSADKIRARSSGPADFWASRRSTSVYLA